MSKPYIGDKIKLPFPPTEKNILEAANYFLTRRPSMVEIALVRLHDLAKYADGFADMDGVLELTLNAIKSFPEHSSLQTVAFKLLFLFLIPLMSSLAPPNTHLRIMRLLLQNHLFNATVSPLVTYMSKMCLIYCEKARQTWVTETKMLDIMLSCSMDTKTELNAKMVLSLFITLEDQITSFQSMQWSTLPTETLALKYISWAMESVEHHGEFHTNFSQH